MYSVSETCENGKLCVTSHPGIWAKEEDLLWPPLSSGIERHEIIAPEPNWTHYKCKVLRENIETFEEALEIEKMYSKHRDSNSFREHQEQKLLKRKHPVNHADNSQLDLIDVNEMVRRIDENTEAQLAQNSKYHENCTTQTQSNGAVAETTVKGKGKKELPFQNNYLKPGVTKAKDRLVPNVAKSKVSRYSNFLKSGKRSDGPIKKPKPNGNVSSATITKAQHLKRIGETGELDLNDLNDENVASVPKTCGITSTPVEAQAKTRQENYITGNNVMSVSKAKGRTFSNVTNSKFSPNDDFLKSGNNSDGLFTKKKTNGTVPSATITKKQYLHASEASEVHYEDVDEEAENSVHVPTSFGPFNPQEINRQFSRPVDNVQQSKPTSFQGPSFEERVLQELSNLKKGQELFETRIETKIETFIKDQSTNIQNNRQSSVQGNGQSHIRFQSRQQGRLQVRHRDPAPHRYVDDLDDYDELDEKFPLDAKHYVEELEYNIRTNLEFKFLLNSRLNELSGKSYEKCIRLKMAYLFTNPVQECYSWRGTERKGAFKNLTAINNLILRSVRDRFPNTHKDEYKDYMMTWLKSAKTRQRKVTYTYPNRRDLNRGDASYSDEENF